MYTIDEKVSDQIERTFTYHQPVGNQAERYGRIRNEANALAKSIAHNAPPSRELSLALTHLQEAVMFANAAIAINEEWHGNKMVKPLQISV